MEVSLGNITHCPWFFPRLNVDANPSEPPSQSQLDSLVEKTNKSLEQCYPIQDQTIKTQRLLTILNENLPLIEPLLNTAILEAAERSVQLQGLELQVKTIAEKSTQWLMNYSSLIPFVTSLQSEDENITPDELKNLQLSLAQRRHELAQFQERYEREKIEELQQEIAQLESRVTSCSAFLEAIKKFDKAPSLPGQLPAERLLLQTYQQLKGQVGSLNRSIVNAKQLALFQASLEKLQLALNSLTKK